MEIAKPDARSLQTRSNPHNNVRILAILGNSQGIDISQDQLQNIAPQVGLRQLLKGQVRSEAIKDRIVLIGVTASSGSDIWTTPKGSSVDQRVPGVFIQAQMTSQLINAVLNQRSLIWAWPLAVEGVWVIAWGFLGGGLGLMVRRWGWQRGVWLSGVGWTGGWKYWFINDRGVGYR